MVTTCCVVRCRSRSGGSSTVYTQDGSGRRVPDKLSFYRIPAELNNSGERTKALSRIRRQEWLNAIRRKDLTENKIYYSRICSRHFISGKPASLGDVPNPDWVPSINMGYNNESSVSKLESYKKREDQLQVHIMPTCCAITSCKSRAKRGSGVNFYKIPSILHFKHQEQLNSLSRIRHQKWLDAIQRGNLTESRIKNARVCGKHFVSGKPAPLLDYKSPNWVPTLHIKHEISVNDKRTQISSDKNNFCNTVKISENKKNSSEKTARNQASNSIINLQDEDNAVDQSASPSSHSESETLSCSADDMLDDVIDDSNYNLNSTAVSLPPHKPCEMAEDILESSNSKNQDVDLTECHTCVCCLQPNATTNIFQGVYESSIITGGLSEVSLSQIFSSLTGIEVQDESTFEHVLCDECLELLTSFYDFKLKVMHSYTYLQKQNSESTDQKQSKDVDHQGNINEIDLTESSDDMENCDNSVTNQMYQSYDDPEPVNVLKKLGKTPGNINKPSNGETMAISTEIGENEELLLEPETWDNLTNEITQNIYINLETNEQIDFDEVSKLTDLKNIIRLDVALPNEIIENLEIYNPNNKMQEETIQVLSEDDAEEVENYGRNPEVVLPPKRRKLLPGSEIVLTQNTGQCTKSFSPKKPIAKLKPSTKFKSKLF